MDSSYLMMLYVTLDQERALKQFFIEHGWMFNKPDLTLTTDKIGPPGMPALPVSHAEKAAETPAASTSSLTANQTLSVTPSVFRLSGRKRKLTAVTRRSPPSKQPKSHVEAEDDDTIETDFSNNVLNKSANLTFPITVECGNQEQVVVKLERADDSGLEHVQQTYQANQSDATNNLLDKEIEGHSDNGDNYDDGDDDNSDNIVDDSLDAAEQPSATSEIETVNDTKEDILVPYQKQGSTMDHTRKINVAVSTILVDIEEDGKLECDTKETWQTHQCRICSKQFSSNSNLTRHMKNHNPSSSYQCTACEKWFHRKDSLMKHEANMHSKKEPETHLCSVCGKECKSKHALYNHQQIHVKTLQCDVCAFTCSRRHNLERHKRTHSQAKSQCPNCLKHFMDVPSHLVVCRDDPRPSFECEYCGTLFKAKRYLTAHKSTMHGHKTYPCSVCNKEFKHRATRLFHFNKCHREYNDA